jgi:multidrug efflux pump subunit AcrA (membrane-fusion protein)
MEKEQGLFRQEALERLRSPDQLDKLFAPATPVAWIALCSVLLLVLAAVIWSVFGVLSSKVNGSGLIIDSAGVINISPTVGGRLADLRVERGDRVRKGQIVAIIAQPDLEAEIARVNQELSNAGSSAEMAAKSASRNELRARLERESQVVSPVDGVVSDQIVSGYGDIVSPGTPIVSVRLDENKRGELMVLLYVPVLDGKKIQPGMNVQVSPGSVDASEYGTLIARVLSVSNYPVLPESITGWTGNAGLTDWIIKQTGGLAVEVKAELIKDSDTRTGYLWSSLHGSPAAISSGTICTGGIVIERKAPISKAFLKLNQWLRND